jgi:hypothetical protein
LKPLPAIAEMMDEQVFAVINGRDDRSAKRCAATVGSISPAQLTPGAAPCKSWLPQCLDVGVSV